MFLALSAAITIAGAGARRGTAVAATAGIGLLFAVGAVAAGTLLAGMSSWTIELLLAFGMAALLYLVVEELLVEAHTTRQTPVLASSFFLGFLGVLLVRVIDRS